MPTRASRHTSFNPRAREGRDIPNRYLRQYLLVSIHAPARGATAAQLVVLAWHHCFNPRAREGRDAPLPPCQQHSRSFNPRAREGRDTFACQKRRYAKSFNPRAREGRDGGMGHRHF